MKYPWITVEHGAEHVVSLFFSDAYKNASKILNVLDHVSDNIDI
jgi:hypothetical protein